MMRATTLPPANRTFLLSSIVAPRLEVRDCLSFLPAWLVEGSSGGDDRLGAFYINAKETQPSQSSRATEKLKVALHSHSYFWTSRKWKLKCGSIATILITFPHSGHVGGGTTKRDAD
jgi:hypothetical protein